MVGCLNLLAHNDSEDLYIGHDGRMWHSVRNINTIRKSRWCFYASDQISPSEVRRHRSYFKANHTKLMSWDHTKWQGRATRKGRQEKAKKLCSLIIMRGEGLREWVSSWLTDIYRYVLHIRRLRPTTDERTHSVTRQNIAEPTSQSVERQTRKAPRAREFVTPFDSPRRRCSLWLNTDTNNQEIQTRIIGIYRSTWIRIISSVMWEKQAKSKYIVGCCLGLSESAWMARILSLIGTKRPASTPSSLVVADSNSSRTRAELSVLIHDQRQQ